MQFSLPCIYLYYSWWKVRAKSSPSEGQSPADAPTGLVPASYLLPLPPLKQVTAIYEYTATSEEEITIQEEATYDLYEDDGDWSLVGARGKKEVGYAPSAYLEVSDGCHRNATGFPMLISRLPIRSRAVVQ